MGEDEVIQENQQESQISNEPTGRLIENRREVPQQTLARQVTILPLDYGYNVNVGCQSFAVETQEKLIKNLEAYLKDPQATEMKWRKNKELL